MKLVVLYEELAAYFVKCILTFAHKYSVDVHIIHKGVNSDAPFKMDLSGIKTYKRSDYSDEQLMDLVKTINPDAIFSGGWQSKIYLKIVYAHKNIIPAIVGFDNQWKGSLKQRLATLISPFKILNHFSYCWVPGSLQYEYAIRLGFKEDRITTGVYSCDFDLFHNQYLKNIEEKKKRFPKRFMYVGRYVEHKGIKDLWQAFIEIQHEKPNEWELWCLGTGDVEPAKHDKIKHFGFVQPNEMSTFIKETGVFVLPSHFEPWGVVIHEFAAAGFPIVCTDEVGARLDFMDHNYNGYVYKAGDVNELKRHLKKIIDLNDQELIAMGERSVEKAKQITPEKWADILMNLLNKANLEYVRN